MSIMDYLRRWGDGRTASWREICPILKDNAEAYQANHMEEEWLMESVWNQLDSECRKRYQRGRIAEDQQPLGALPRVFLAPDRMTAYLCVLPPQSGGTELEEEQLREALEEGEVRFGIFEDALTDCVQQKRYLEIIPIARGQEAKEGAAGRLEPLFEEREEQPLEQPGGEPMDFSAFQLPQTVQEGESICNIVIPIPGEDGLDVSARVIPCQKYRYPEIPMGENTSISEDGQRLVAEKEGLVWFRDGKFYVREQKFISGSLTTPGCSCRIRGSLLITANVCGGATVTAGGDILIGGEVQAAQVISTGGSVRILRGVRGVNGKTVIRAAEQVQALYLDRAKVEAGGDVIAEAVTDCHVVSGGSVYCVEGKGVIFGGHVQASELIQCCQLGNITGKRNQITVGFSPEASAERERLDMELESTQTILERLWKKIGDIRKAGRLMTDEQKELLEQLVEQRALYEAHAENLKSKQKKLREELKQISGGRVCCGQLYGRTEVRIGGCFAEYRSAEKECDIHISGGNLVLH